MFQEPGSLADPAPPIVNPGGPQCGDVSPTMVQYAVNDANSVLRSQLQSVADTGHDACVNDTDYDYTAFHPQRFWPYSYLISPLILITTTITYGLTCTRCLILTATMTSGLTLSHHSFSLPPMSSGHTHTLSYLFYYHHVPNHSSLISHYHTHHSYSSYILTPLARSKP